MGVCPVIQSENRPMKIGYARVSTTDQNPALQLTALKREGCEKIFTDKASIFAPFRFLINSAR